MRQISFGEGWKYRHLNSDDAWTEVTLPHDAMLHENRSIESAGMHNIGWFEGWDYEYVKTFTAPSKEEAAHVFFEFEGVYHNAEVYLNGDKVCERPYGYTQIYFDATGRLIPGEENEIRVVAHNADQPNSRWYSGSGIYRPVWMYTGSEEYLPLYGLKVRTLSINPAVIEVVAETSAAGTAFLSIFDPEGKAVAENQTAGAAELTDGAAAAAGAGRSADGSRGNICPSKPFRASWRIEVPDAQLWDTEHPNLYTAKVRFGGDAEETAFGIRTLTWDSDNGIAINGKHVILRGACIHSDNQLLGAATFPEAEARRVRILKENSYNAIRSAHNPACKWLLDECDRQGVLFMDEYVDCWYIHKTRYDYASYVLDWWKEDLRDMVDKDFNHPSVVLYSTGNEVAETGQKKGIQFVKSMTKYLHSLDPSRPVSCGINIFFNLMYKMGFGVYSDDKAKKEAAKAEKSGKKKQNPVGSEFYNTIAGIFGDKTMKMGATLHGCDVLTRDSFANMDVAGYNYGLFRYGHDLRKYPDRLILGSETFCKDAVSFWEQAKKNPRIVGDFVWAGMDYLGEAGIGSTEYEDYAPRNADRSGWIAAGSGRLDLTGKPIGEARYTQVAFEQDMGPFIAVSPVYQTGYHTRSAWKMTDAIESWSWRGCEGTNAKIEVYARAASVDLILNGKKIGTKKPGRSCIARFTVPYENGKLEAVSRDESGREIGRRFLETAKENVSLHLLPETEKAEAGKLVYVRLRYADDNGIWAPMGHHSVKVRVENGSLEALGNACPFNPDGYLTDTTKTYYGEALAIVRAGESGDVKVIAEDGESSTSVEIPIE